MTERPSGRHRASHKSTASALSTLTGPLSVVSGRMETVRRSGVIIAMSSGLMASMALPAHAVTGAPELSGPQTASIPAAQAAPAVAAPAQAPDAAAAFFAAPQGGLLSLPAGLALDDGTVSAPAAATLDFDHTAFVAVPKVDLGRGGASTSARSSLTDTADPGTDAEQAPAKAPATRREARQASTTSSSSSGSPADSSSSSSSSAVPASALGSQVVAIASRYIGRPYRYGAAGPSSFDCSGLVQYVFAQLGKSLPRTAADQAAAVRHIPRSQAQPGDLVLFPGGGHIGIYVGDGMMLDAPHTGTTVQIRKIYSASAGFGRVL